jgi:hypothetical protein
MGVGIIGAAVFSSGQRRVSGPDELVRTAQCIGAPRGALGIRIVMTSLTGACLPSTALHESCRDALDLGATRAVRDDGPEVSNRDADVSIPLILGQAPPDTGELLWPDSDRIATARDSDATRCLDGSAADHPDQDPDSLCDLVFEP